MSIKDKYYVESIPAKLTHEWLLKKHYAKRLPMALEFCFGLYNSENILNGVCIFGPTSPTVPKTIFGELGKHKVKELTRLVINDSCDKNAGSYFIGSCLKLLPKPMCLVSFADSNMNHHGYIYQATNWIYTGEGGADFIYYDINGTEIHLLTIHDRMKSINCKKIDDFLDKYKIKKEETKPKYRYIYFLGNKREIKIMKGDFKLNNLLYPKGDNQRYNTSYKPIIQTKLF